MIPHTYPDPLRPCLYYPTAREWTPEQLIADTIVPWLMVWLLFYECWLVTGTWEGGGVAHAPAAKPEPDDEHDDAEPPDRRPVRPKRRKRRRR